MKKLTKTLLVALPFLGTTYYASEDALPEVFPTTPQHTTIADLKVRMDC